MPGKIQQEIQSPRSLPTLEVELALNVLRTAEILGDLTNEILAPAGIGREGFNVLRILRGAGGTPLPRTVVAERMVGNAERLAAELHGLRTRGLVSGTLQLAITPEGLALLATLDGAMEEAYRARFGGVPATMLRAAIEALERVRAAVRTTVPPPSP
jgi:hypothetical protein